MNDLKVSIKVLCYNQEKYIRQTLDSILNQEHPYSYEVIVCDDASQDSTPNIIEEYASKHKEIIPVLRKKNIGLIANYFDAVSRCRGEYIMGCAGDDYWLPNKVASQVEYMDSHPDVGLCYGDALKIDERGNPCGEWKGQPNNEFEDVLTTHNISAGSICQRRDLLDKYILEIQPLNLPWKMEDLPMLLWFAYNSKIHYIQNNMMVYRMLTESVSHSKSIVKLIPYLQSIKEIKNYFIELYKLYPKQPLVEYSYFLDLISFLPSANEEYKKMCLDQLEKCRMNWARYYIYRLRIRSKAFNKFSKYVIAIKGRLKKISSLKPAKEIKSIPH